MGGAEDKNKINLLVMVGFIAHLLIFGYILMI